MRVFHRLQKRERAGTLRCPKCGAKLVLTAEE
nr:MAG TPA: 60S ribosomal protein L2-A [Caudoviricetes sp.]